VWAGLVGSIFVVMGLVRRFVVIEIKLLRIILILDSFSLLSCG
jgi:hypothetical protein